MTDKTKIIVTVLVVIAVAALAVILVKAPEGGKPAPDVSVSTADDTASDASADGTASIQP